MTNESPRVGAAYANETREILAKERARLLDLMNFLQPFADAGTPMPEAAVEECKKLALLHGRGGGAFDVMMARHAENARALTVRLAVGYALQSNEPHEGTATSQQKMTLLLALLVAKAYGLPLDPEIFGSFNPPRGVGPASKEQSHGSQGQGGAARAL